MANILEDSTKMTYWSRVVGGGITFISATYYFLTFLLFVKLLRFGFLDRNTRSSGQKDNHIQHLGADLYSR